MFVFLTARPAECVGKGEQRVLAANTLVHNFSELFIFK
jgi:hypothetical protein